MQRKKVLLSWSGGKDSAWALHTLRQNSAYDVVALLTTVNEKFGRVAIHGFREELLDSQASATSLPVWKIPLPYPCTNADYETRMQAVCERAVQEGFDAVAFGDLFLEDIRAYRVERLAGTGLEPLFPIWGIPTDQLARQMVAAGLRARITCVNPRHLPASFCGRVFDSTFLADLPATVDPCGERGEFHSFACAGPMFTHPISVEHTLTVEREGFVYGEIVLQEPA
ncbi:MAG TPA: ATP-binding protein [Acidobacteriaceae bacterium]|nr:ATP-binding protein [Acidobacteriaceae bacterium]